MAFILNEDELKDSENMKCSFQCSGSGCDREQGQRLDIITALERVLAA